MLTDGAGPRASGVVYDHAGSATATARTDEGEWPRILGGAGWKPARDVMPEIIPNLDIGTAGRDDYQKLLVVEAPRGKPMHT